MPIYTGSASCTEHHSIQFCVFSVNSALIEIAETSYTKFLSEFLLELEINEKHLSKLFAM